MAKPICQNFTELAAYLRDIDPAAATSIAKSILERVDIPELREFVCVTPPLGLWENITRDCLMVDKFCGAPGIAVPFARGDRPFFTPFIVAPNPVWDKASLSVAGNPVVGGYEVALRDGKIVRRKV